MQKPRCSRFKKCDFTDADMTGVKLTRKAGTALKLSQEQKCAIDWQDEEGEEPEGGYATTQAAERADILNIGGFSDQVFDVVAAFAEGKLGADHWVGVIEQVKL